MGSNKRLAISIVSNIVSVAVSLGVSFLLTPYLLRTLGKEAYSFFPLANNFVSYMTIITLALNSMASRFLTIEIVRGNDEKAHTYFSSVFFSNVILSVVLMIPMTLIVGFVDRILNVPATIIEDVRTLFIFVFLSMIVNLISSVFGISTFAKERMDLRAYREIGQNIIRAGLFVFFFSTFPPTIIFLGIVSAVVAIGNGCIQYMFTRILMPEYRVHIKEFDIHAVVELVKSGVWNSVNNLGSILTMSLGVLLANKYLGASASGDMSIVQTLPQFMTSIISAVYGVLLARIAVVYARNNAAATQRTVINTQKILGIICTVPAVMIIVYGEYFFKLWVPNEDAHYLQMLSIISVLPVLLHSTMWTVYGLNVTNNQIKAPALFLIGSGIISLLLTLILLKTTTWGVFAITGVSSFFNTLFYLMFIPMYAAKKMNFELSVFYPHILKSLLFSVVIILLFYPITKACENILSSWLGFFVMAGVSEIIGVVIYSLLVCSTEDRNMILATIKLKSRSPHYE